MGPLATSARGRLRAAQSQLRARPSGVLGMVSEFLGHHPALDGYWVAPVVELQHLDGRLLAMDSSARCFEGGLRQFDLYRDQRCRLSGGRIVDIDHVEEAAKGGPTSAGNGQGLAKNPHVIKDHPQISVRGRDPGPGW